MAFKSQNTTDSASKRPGPRDTDFEHQSLEEPETESALRVAAEAWGHIPDELLFGVSPQTEKAQDGILYRHPFDSRLTWHGSGARPAWVRQWEASGRSLDELRGARPKH